MFYEHLLLRLLKWIFNRGGLWLLPLLRPAQSSCRLKKKKKKVFVEETRGMSVSDWWWRTPPNTLIHLLKVAVARLLLLLPSATTRNNQRWKDDPSPEAAKRFREPVKGRRNPERDRTITPGRNLSPPFFFLFIGFRFHLFFFPFLLFRMQCVFRIYLCISLSLTLFGWEREEGVLNGS